MYNHYTLKTKTAASKCHRFVCLSAMSRSI
nr:MAG TPA: hypothetical protein [Caudoviricetes sp.]